MKKIWLSMAVVSVLSADEGVLQKVTIETEADSITVKDVSHNEIKSADIADALSRHIPSINLIRRSGIANDILVRGQKRDNINIVIDGAKVCGACINRMDPPTSHVLSNNIQSIKVSEGPFDVENFGSLSALVDIQTLKPTKDLKGELNFNVGSFDYRKMAGNISGGNEMFRLLLSASSESQDQYKDGYGDRLYEQVIKATEGTKMAGAQYQKRYENMRAFKKSTLLSKLFVDIDPDQALELSYTANRSDDVLYPSSKMDAIYDDSDIYNLHYRYKNLTLQLYNSKVDHPMSNRYRKMGLKKEKTHKLTTDMKGAKLKAAFQYKGIEMIAGLDMSRRNWDGHFESNGEWLKMANGMKTPKSLDDVDTTNRALFLKAKQHYGASKISYGVRYDDTDITTRRSGDRDRSFRSWSANVFTETKIDESMRYFWGVGSASRVPDARELYLLMMGDHIGSPDLKQSHNYEVDLGGEKIFDNFSVKLKTYYSFIKDYIAFNSHNKRLRKDGKMGAFHSFENVDATIWGAELSGMVLSDWGIDLDYSLSYKRGKKRHPLTGQHGRNLPDMRPLKAVVGLNYEAGENSARVEFIGATKWDKIDYENGEQKLSGYGVVNLKAARRFGKKITVSLGVDNLFDKRYAITNTYRDLILLSTGSGQDDIMLLNEPGRYLYANVKMSF